MGLQPFRHQEKWKKRDVIVHNLYYLIHLMQDIRQAILEDRFQEFRSDFWKQYKMN